MRTSIVIEIVSTLGMRLSLRMLRVAVAAARTMKRHCSFADGGLRRRFTSLVIQIEVLATKSCQILRGVHIPRANHYSACRRSLNDYRQALYHILHLSGSSHSDDQHHPHSVLLTDGLVSHIKNMGTRAIELVHRRSVYILYSAASLSS